MLVLRAMVHSTIHKIDTYPAHLHLLLRPTRIHKSRRICHNFLCTTTGYASIIDTLKTASDASAMNTLLHQHIIVKGNKDVEGLWVDMKKLALPTDINTYKIFLDHFSIQGDVVNSTAFFQYILEMGQADALSYLALMRAYGLNQDVDKVVEVIKSMLSDKRIEYNSTSFQAILLCVARFAPNYCENVFMAMIDLGLQVDQGALHVMLSLFAQRGDTSGITRMVSAILDNGDANTPLLLTTLCEELSSFSDVTTVLAIINEFERRDIPLIAQVYAILINALAKTQPGDMDSITIVFNWMEKLGVRPNQVFYHKLVTTFAKEMDETRALNVFNMMKRSQHIPWTLTYNVLMRMYVAMGKFHAVNALYIELKSVGLKPDLQSMILAGITLSVEEQLALIKEGLANGATLDTFGYRLLISFCIKQRDFKTMWELLSRVQEKNLARDPCFWSCFDQLCKNNIVSEIHKFVKWAEAVKLPRTEEAYMSLVTIYGIHQDTVRLSLILERMQREQIIPSDANMLIIQDACAKALSISKFNAFVEWRKQILAQRQAGDIAEFWAVLNKPPDPNKRM